MVCGSATAADMWERAGMRAASRQTVETEANEAVLRGLAERIGIGTETLATHKAVRLSLAREGYGPKFCVHLVPANAKVICGLVAKMFVVGQKSGTLEFGGRPTNNLLVFEQFRGLPWMGADHDQCIPGGHLTTYESCQ